MVQVTVFSCGGIAVGIYTSQKIIDGYSHITFLAAWAAAASGEISEQINPNFTSPSIFLPISTLPDSKRMTIPMIQERRRNCTTRRFLFSTSSLINLKKKAGPSSTRVMAVTGLIWKCAIDASRKLRPPTSKHDHVMLFPIDLRSKSSPPLPPYCIGNIVITTNSTCARNDDAGLHSLVEKLKNEDDQVDSEFIEKLKGEEGSRNIEGSLLDEEDCDRNEDVEITSVTNMCNGMMYEINFGWGRPIYVSVGNGEPYAPPVKNSVILMDTIYRDEIEAWVTLSEDDMTVFEQDPNLLSSASLNPSPLESFLYWLSVGVGDQYIPYVKNFMALMDTKSGDGIEVWVTLSVEDMTIIEQDPELLSFATLNPSPLENDV
ncbi:hypothetical protein RD792_017529 [Penstemon davidsonii]|uniref:Uncharacterized protein n=1 Tax=Penstemon davidsonii TaxID=160366 RepID=A0ABR0CM98_9LAMI|nr:hypothetical protein RD792_017529 [Penstemon davidsonii]